MSTLHRSADEHVARLKAWTRNLDQVNQTGARQPGVNEAMILFYLNEGKDNIQRAVANQAQSTFVEPETVVITSRLKEYSIPSTAISSRVAKVEYSVDGSEKKFTPLRLQNFTSWVYSEGQPCYYAKRGNRIMPYPVPESGVLRIWIQRRDDELDVRRGVITTSGEVLTGANLTSIILETVDTPNADAFSEAEFVCVSDWEGEVKAYNIPIASWDVGANTLNVRQPFPWTAGTIEEGDVITIGKNTTTHSKLDKDFEQYYVEWAILRVRGWDSNSETYEGAGIISTLRAEILDAHSDSADQEMIPNQGNATGDWFG